MCAGGQESTAWQRVWWTSYLRSCPVLGVLYREKITQVVHMRRMVLAKVEVAAFPKMEEEEWSGEVVEE